ncbi:MAG: ThuA domain-containing protein [Planctomycetaceae bacterium]|nr:ThuA domain-containing protein [Planctomycetaceae bacterium]
MKHAARFRLPVFPMRLAASCLAVAACFLTAGTQHQAAAADAAPTKKLQLLLIDGQNNHDWRKTTPVLKSFLEQTGRFEVTVATTPTAKNAPEAEWDSFQPDFSAADVVLSNYNGELWPERVQKGLEKFVADGGGLVIVHAANNAFPQWPEFNEMIGLGWRGNSFGDRVTLDDNGEQVRTPKGEGPGAGHGPQHAFSVIIRDRRHPVMQGIPAEWMHFRDELYHGQRGPGQNMHVLATAYSSPEQRGTGAHEPMVWWIPFGKGRVFTNVMGHADYSMKCVGFQTIVARGSEWAATGKVTLPVPENFPTAEKTSVNDPNAEN